MTPYVFIEEPFGTNRETMSPLIDYAVLLDLPLERCLSRKITRHTTKLSLNSTNSICCYLDKYEGHFREIYRETVRQVRINCDFIINEETIDVDPAKSNWLLST